MSNLDKLKKQYEKLGKEIESLENKPKAWVCQGEGTVVDICETMSSAKYLSGHFVRKVSEINIYPTTTVGVKMLAWRKLEDKMRIAANGYEFIEGERSWYIAVSEGDIIPRYSCTDVVPGVIYFESVASLFNFVNSLTKDETAILKAGRPVY